MVCLLTRGLAAAARVMATPPSSPLAPPPAPPANAPLTAVGGQMKSVLFNARFVAWDFSAASCIDGIWGAGAASASDWSTCHNDVAETRPWLSVWLPAAAYVSSVLVHNRGDCCQQHLGSYQVWVGDAVGDPLASPGRMAQCQPGDALIAPETSGPFTVTCELVGTHVTLLLPGANRELMLDELVPVGHILAPSPPV